MNKLKTIILALIILTVPSTVFAQFSIGIKAGMTVDNLKFSEDIMDAENTTGFSGGIMAELMIPVVSLGVDASLLYRYSGSTISIGELYNEVADGGSNSYLDIPVNLKWKISLPAIEKIIAPIIFTGPCFSVLLKDNAISDAWEYKSFSTSWNIGLGCELFSKLQVTGAYCLALSDAIDITDPASIGITDVDFKSNYWSINLAYLF